jgi:hypothetical protein
MVHITFYVTTADRRWILKPLANGIQTTAELYDNTDIFTPELKLAWNNDYASRINYFYIEEFKRYYFLEDVVAEPGGAARVKGSLDVLYTYHNSIMMDDITITRAFNSKIDAPADVSGLFTNSQGPTYIKDSKLPLNPQREIEVYEFSGNNPFNLNTAEATSMNFVLNVMGRTPS